MINSSQDTEEKNIIECEDIVLEQYKMKQRKKWKKKAESVSYKDHQAV